MSPFLTLRSKHFTDVLRVQALLHGGSYNITPSQVSVGAFRTTGAMALFNAGVDSTRIRLLGRWNSWAMLRYLHVQSNTQMASFAHRMLSGGSFTSLACMCGDRLGRPSHSSSVSRRHRQNSVVLLQANTDEPLPYPSV